MTNSVIRSKLPSTIGVALSLVFWARAAAENVVYKPVSKDIVETRLRRYSGDNQQRKGTLKQLFIESGCRGANLSEQQVKASRQPNIICTLPGSANKVIIVGAHFDRVSQGDGVVDNWSSASLLPSLYEAIKLQPRTHTYVFVGFTDEEHGEIGSHFYAHQMSKEQVASTAAMVNMDTLGLGPTAIWASRSDKRLNAAIAYIAKQLHVPVMAVNVEQIGSTDSEQFVARGIPSITIHSLTQETWNAHIIHTFRDKFSAVRLDDHYQTYCLVAAYIAFLDQIELPPPN